MSQIELAQLLVRLAGAYLAVGALVTLMVQLRSGAMQRIDPATAGAGIGFRLLVVPGMVLLWPWMLLRSRGSRPERDEAASAARIRRWQRALTAGLALLLPLGLIGALQARPELPDSAAAEPAPAADAPEPLDGALLLRAEEIPIHLLPRRGAEGTVVEIDIAPDDLERLPPGLLLYWRSSAADSEPAIEDSDRLLGVLPRERRSLLVADDLDVEEPGMLLLYDSIGGRVLDRGATR